jgi:hypothetical protein
LFTNVAQASASFATTGNKVEVDYCSGANEDLVVLAKFLEVVVQAAPNLDELFGSEHISQGSWENGEIFDVNEVNSMVDGDLHNADWGVG